MQGSKSRGWNLDEGLTFMVKSGTQNSGRKPGKQLKLYVFDVIFLM